MVHCKPINQLSNQSNNNNHNHKHQNNTDLYTRKFKMSTFYIWNRKEENIWYRNENNLAHDIQQLQQHQQQLILRNQINYN